MQCSENERCGHSDAAMKGEPILAVYFAKPFVIALECCLFVLLTVYLFVFFRILLSKEVCHPNLRVLLIFQTATHWCALLMRMLAHAASIAGVLNQLILDWLNFFVNICRFGWLGHARAVLGTTTGLMLGYSIERLYAMYTVDTYEQIRSPRLGWSLSAAIWTWYFGFISVRYFFAVFYSIFGVSTVFFLALWVVCKCIYKTTARRRLATIEERFRTGRNLHASELLMWIGPYKSVTNTLSLYLYGYVYQHIASIYLPLCIELYYIFNYAQLISLVSIVIYKTKALRREFCAFVGRRKVSPDLADISIRSLTGQQLHFTADQQKNIYFAALEKDLGGSIKAALVDPRAAKYR